MRPMIAFVLIAVGGLLIAVGLTRALMQFGSMYQDVSERPLDAPETSPEQRAERMLWSAGLGAAGVPLMLAGTIMFKVKRRKLE